MQKLIQTRVVNLRLSVECAKIMAAILRRLYIGSVTARGRPVWMISTQRIAGAMLTRQ